MEIAITMPLLFALQKIVLRRRMGRRTWFPTPGTVHLRRKVAVALALGIAFNMPGVGHRRS